MIRGISSGTGLTVRRPDRPATSTRPQVRARPRAPVRVRAPAPGPVGRSTRGAAGSPDRAPARARARVPARAAARVGVPVRGPGEVGPVPARAAAPGPARATGAGSGLGDHRSAPRRRAEGWVRDAGGLEGSSVTCNRLRFRRGFGLRFGSRFGFRLGPGRQVAPRAASSGRRRPKSRRRGRWSLNSSVIDRPRERQDRVPILDHRSGRVKDVPRETPRKSQLGGEGVPRGTVAAGLPEWALSRDPFAAGPALGNLTPRAPATMAPVSPWRIDAADPNPRVASPSDGQPLPRATPVSGGSVTTSRPPTARKPTAHSAVTAGAEKHRATTRSNGPRHAGSRASRSARPQHDLGSDRPDPGARPPARGTRTGAAERPAGSRWSRASVRRGRVPGGRHPIRGPRTAPPNGPMAVARSLECARTGVTRRPGPRNPSSRESSRTADSSARSITPAPTSGGAIGPGRSELLARVGSSRPQDHPAPGLLALGLGGHAVDLGGGVVDDLAVARRHRLERLGPARLEHLRRRASG